MNRRKLFNPPSKYPGAGLVQSAALKMNLHTVLGPPGIEMLWRELQTLHPLYQPNQHYRIGISKDLEAEDSFGVGHGTNLSS